MAQSKKPTAKKATKKAAPKKKQPGKKATAPKAKPAPSKQAKAVEAKVDKALQDASETITKKFVEAEKFVAEVIYANDVKVQSLRKRMLAWFKSSK